ncbi:MAG: hypothetical protein NTU41_00010, partial [Chloroflexi bacterium]|nr:hypothetical protein [Chloroflexota bacterium]
MTWAAADPESKRLMAQRILRIQLKPAHMLTVEQMVEDALSRDQDYINMVATQKMAEVAASRAPSPEELLREQIHQMALERIEKDPALAKAAMAKEGAKSGSDVGAADPFDTTLDSIGRVLEMKRI